MDTGISTWLFADEKLSKAHLEQIKEAGIDRIEVAGDIFEHFRYDDRRHIDSIAKAVRDLDMKVVSLHAPYKDDFRSLSFRGKATDNTDWAIAESRKMVDALDILRGDILVVHCGHKGDEPNADALLDVVTRDYAQIADYCAEKNVTLAVESQDSFTLELLGRLAGRPVGITLDTGHAYLRGGLMEGLAAAAPHLVHLHVTDATARRGELTDWIASYKDRITDWERALELLELRGSVDHLAPYEGEIDWPQFAGGLDEIGYEGTFLFEVRNTPLPERRRQLLARAVAGYRRMFSEEE